MQKGLIDDSHLGLVSLHDVHCYMTRNAQDFRLPAVKTNWGEQRLSFKTIGDWNSLPLDMRKNTTSLSLSQRYSTTTDLCDVSWAMSTLFVYLYICLVNVTLFWDM